MTVTSTAATRRRRESSATLADATVIGGGMAGAAAALALAGAGLNVTLVEARSPAPWQAADEVDARVVALAPSAVALLAELDAWDAVREARAQAYRHMWVGDAGNGAQLDIDTSDTGVSELGWIVENRLVQHVLWQRLEAAGVHVLCPERVVALETQVDRVRLQLESAGSLDTRMLVAADGGGSPVRDMLGMGTRERDYDQRAVVAHVTTAREHGATARQRFVPGGPVALLPLADGRSSVVWSLPTSEAESVLAMDDAAFCKALAAATDTCLGPIESATPRQSFPLRMQLARGYHKGRTVLLGDAAHTVHPLAGQGINLGLRDVAELRDVLGAAHAQGRDVGNERVLARYARRRRSADTLDAYGLDAVSRMYAWRWPGAVAMRGVGMRAVNAIPSLRRMLAEHAAGTRGG